MCQLSSSEKIAIESTLRRAEVFLGLNDDELKLIASLPSSRLENHQAGDILFRTGDEARNIYVLEEGQVNIMAEIPPKPNDQSTWGVTVDLITKGDLFGWSAIVRPHYYVLSAVCNKPSKLVIMDRIELQDLFDRYYYIGYKVLEELTHVIGSRFRELEQFLINGRRWSFIEKRSGT